MLQDNKKIYIKIRELKSAYSYANRTELDKLQINRAIGSSVSSVSKMLARAEEQRAIMGDVISISPADPEWSKKLKHYWDSLSVDIPETGKELEIGFTYAIDALDKQESINMINKNITKEEDKLKSDEDLKNYIDSRIDKVIEGFNKAIKAAADVKDPREQGQLVKSAYDVKYKSMLNIEAERYKVGTPINAFEYMLYRYCMEYGDVANEKELVGKTPKIRFYLHSKDDIKREKRRKLESERTRTQLLSKVVNNVESMQNLLYAIGEKSIPEDDLDLYALVEEISKSREAEFVAVANDKNLELRGEIEKLIIHGILHRNQGSTLVYEPTDLNKPIGNTIDEVIMFFNNQANKATVSEFRTKFKNLGK